MLAWHVSDRLQHRAEPVEEPAVPPAVAAVLSVLRSSAVVVDDSDVVLQGLRAGLRDGAGARHHAWSPTSWPRWSARCAATARSARPSWSCPRTDAPARHVTARVAPLGSRLVLALVEDRTRERRVEAVRRDFVANVSHELKTPVGAIRLLAEAVARGLRRPRGGASGSPAGCSSRATGSPAWCSRSSSCRGCRATSRSSRRCRSSLDDVIAARRRHQRHRRRRQGDLGGQRRRGGPQGARQRGAGDRRRRQPGGQRRALLRPRLHRARHHQARTTARSRSRSSTRASASRSTEIDRIFERFYRVDPARHRSTGGTGLGLSIVKHVAATHGGEVRVWSVEGQGSTFTLTLPRAEGSRPTRGPTTEQQEERP